MMGKRRDLQIQKAFMTEKSFKTGNQNRSSSTGIKSGIQPIKIFKNEKNIFARYN